MRRLLPCFEGRIGRGGFIGGHLKVLGAVLALMLVLTFIAIAAREMGLSGRGGAPWYVEFSWVFWLIGAPWIAGLYARRFRDLGWPAVLAVVPLASSVARAVHDALETGGREVNLYMALPSPLNFAVLAVEIGGALLFLTCLLLPGRDRGGREAPAAR